MGFFKGSDAVKPLPSVLETDRETTFTHRGVEYHVAFDLSRITYRLRKRMQKIQEGNRDGSEEALMEYIGAVVTAWDVPGSDGEIAPLTFDGVAEVRGDLLEAVSDAMTAVLVGSSPNAAGGDATPVSAPDSAESPASPKG